MGQKIKRYFLLFLTIASMMGTLMVGILAFAHWNEFSLPDAIDYGLVKVHISGIAEDGRFLQPMLAITLSKQSNWPLLVVIPQELVLSSSSGAADVVTVQTQKVMLLRGERTTKVFAYSLDYGKSFPHSSFTYEITTTIKADLEPVLNKIVALQAQYEIVSQLAVWQKYKEVELAEIDMALGRDFSEYRERVNEILIGDRPVEPRLDEYWWWLAFIFFFNLTIVFGRLLWKGLKRDAPPPPDPPDEESPDEDERQDRMEVECLIEHLGAWQLLTEGGMAKIWTAVDQRSGKKVVVKFPRIDSTRVSPDNIKFRFESEIKHHRQMNHPNIVQFLEAGECIHPHSGRKTTYLIQEFINGRTIYQLLRKQGFTQLDSYVISNIVDQIVEVLKYIHQKKVIHRDITWKNIMLDRTGQVHLIDFGNATEFNSDITKELGLPPVGTPLFHAPLDLIGNVPARDFYSLAMLIYAMCAGKPILTLSEKEIERDMRDLYQNLNGMPKSMRNALQWRLQGNFKNERSTVIRKKYFPTVRDMMIEAIEKGKIQTNIRIKVKKNQHDDKDDENNQTALVEK